MTLHAITIPKWGLSMEDGTLSAWLAEEGVPVSTGDEIAEIETSKITNVLESKVTGIFRRRVAAQGEVRRVGALIGVVADAEEDDTAIDAFVSDYEARRAGEVADEQSAPEPQTVSVGGKPIRFLKALSQTATPAIPVVLLHGFGGDHLNWLFNQSALADMRDVYALDLPGHGGSTKDVGDGGFDALAGTVVQWLNALGLQTMHVVGHSMGAGVALALALAHPHRVKSLVSICGAGFGGVLNRDYVEGFIAAHNRKQLKPVVALLFAEPGLATREMLDDLSAFKRIDGVPEALRTLADGALSETSIAALTAAQKTLKTPCLAMFAASDQVLRPPEKLPTGVILIENAGHLPQLEQAAAVNVHIAAFLRAND